MTVRIAIVGDLDPAKHSHRELEAARSLLGSDVETTWVATDSPARRAASRSSAMSPERSASDSSTSGPIVRRCPG